jgi:hypothetical protein
LASKVAVIASSRVVWRFCQFDQLRGVDFSEARAGAAELASTIANADATMCVEMHTRFS